jgi:hypothetical protein
MERFRGSIKVYRNNMRIVNVQSMSRPSPPRPYQILRAGISVLVTCKKRHFLCATHFLFSADVDKSKRRSASKITVYLQILFPPIAFQEYQSASRQLPTFGVSSKFLRKIKFRRKSVVNFPPETSSAPDEAAGIDEEPPAFTLLDEIPGSPYSPDSHRHYMYVRNLGLAQLTS